MEVCGGVRLPLLANGDGHPSSSLLLRGWGSPARVRIRACSNKVRKERPSPSESESESQQRWRPPLSSSSSSSSFSSLLSVAPILLYPSIGAESTGYSQASYYTSLGLFVISVPGLWSLIKRSAKSKIVQKTFTVPAPSNGENGKSPMLIAGEITSFFTRNNFLIADRGETITFEGRMVPSRGQAAFLTFCTLISLWSVSLVLTITFPDVGDKWYWLTSLSPLAGVYYWKKASRLEQIKVKMVVADDESLTDVIMQGDDEQIDRLRRELQLMEKVEGIQILGYVFHYIHFTLPRPCVRSWNIPRDSFDASH